MKSVLYVLLQCLAHERQRALPLVTTLAALRAAVARFLAAQASPAAALVDDEVIVAFLRNDFMGGAEEVVRLANIFACGHYL